MTMRSKSALVGALAIVALVGSPSVFAAVAQRESGLDLDAFFEAWLFTQGKPTNW